MLANGHGPVGRMQITPQVQVQVMSLKKPRGQKGFVMRVDFEEDVPRLFNLVELDPGKFWRRGFRQYRISQADSQSWNNR